MTEGLIGVIVPVYKVEKYIAECIESILAQTHTKFRLILVDDGTPDNAGKICDEYAKKDSRITVIHQENAGVTRARARGVEEAKDCEFVSFVDGDDTLPYEALYKLVELMNKDTDIVVGTFKTCCDRAGNNIITLTAKEYILSLIPMNTDIPQAPWGKLIRRELFSKEVLDIPKRITIGEDAIMNIRLAARSRKRIIFLGKKIYNYRISTDSATNRFINSLTYQLDFYKILENSIPPDIYEEALPEIVSRLLWEWGKFYRYSPKKNEKEDMPFIRLLKDKIRESNFHLNIFDRIQLYCPIKLIRFISINIHKMKNLI